MSEEATALTPAPSPSDAPAEGTPATPIPQAPSSSDNVGNVDHVGTADVPKNPLATEGVDPKPEGAEAADGKADAEAGAPETYGDFTFPEGIVVNEQLMGEFTPIAKELGLSQDQAQKLVDLQTSELARQAQTQQDTWDNLNEEWVSTAKADREIGGSEEKFNENVSVALQALEHFGTPELSEALTVTGAGNHPEMIRFMVRVGKAIAEDKMVTGRTAPGGEKKSLAQSLFPSMQNP